MAEPLRILLVEGSGRGFLSHYVHALALGLAEAGHAVRLVTGRRDELAGWPVPFAKAACLGPGLRGWVPLIREVRTFRPDLVHFQWIGDPFAGCAAIAWLRRRGIRVVYTPHNLLPHRGRWLAMPIFRRLYQRVDRVVARDPHMIWAAEEMLGVTPDKLALLPGSPNLIALPQGPRTPPPELPSKAADEIRLLHFGHGSARKGLGLLLETLAGRVWSATLHLVLAGEEVRRGVDPGLVQAAQARLRVSVVDRYVGPSEVAALFESADLLLMPYLKRCSSPIVDLAAAFRLPVLRSDRVEGAQFREGVHGATVRRGDPRALAEALAGLLDAPAELVRLRSALAREEPMSLALRRVADGHARLYAGLKPRAPALDRAPRMALAAGGLAPPPLPGRR